jgi:hypothetical protein
MGVSSSVVAPSGLSTLRVLSVNLICLATNQANPRTYKAPLRLVLCHSDTRLVVPAVTLLPPVVFVQVLVVVNLALLLEVLLLSVTVLFWPVALALSEILALVWTGAFGAPASSTTHV